MTSGSTCPACDSTDLEAFHSKQGIPTNSCLLLADATAAADYPRGDLALQFCRACGFIYNSSFDESLARYESSYEETQAYSPRFQQFARELAKDWVDRYDLSGKSVLEIGCGKGEFLVHMVEQGAGTGVGIDPGVHPERIDSPLADRLTWITDFWGERHSDRTADAIVSRHTLEHIAPVGEFLRRLRASIGDRTDTIVLFELPDVLRVLQEVAFWDVYYEHCSYFSAGSMARLFRREGFEVLDIRRAFDDQYLLLEARPAAGRATGEPLPIEDDLDLLRDGVQRFRQGYESTIEGWRAELERVRRRGGTAVIWGAGSKGVAYLQSLGDLVTAAVDINPNKHGMYLAGTGHSTIPPAALQELRPELVVAMNPVYLDEIQRDLDGLGLSVNLKAV